MGFLFDTHSWVKVKPGFLGGFQVMVFVPGVLGVYVRHGH